jgi:hypothetical protein
VESHLDGPLGDAEFCCHARLCHVVFISQFQQFTVVMRKSRKYAPKIDSLWRVDDVGILRAGFDFDPQLDPRSLAPDPQT